MTEHVSYIWNKIGNIGKINPLKHNIRPYIFV